MNKLEQIIEAKQEFIDKLQNIIGEEIELDDLPIMKVSLPTLLELYAQSSRYLNVSNFYREEGETNYFTMNNHKLSFEGKEENKKMIEEEKEF
jgi:hypothetical protein